MSLYNLNNLPRIVSIDDTDVFLTINKKRYTTIEVFDYLNGNSSPVSDSDTIIVANRSTGVSKVVTMLDVVNFVGGSTSVMTNDDIIFNVRDGVYKGMTLETFYDRMHNFSLTDIAGLQVWYDATDNSTLTLSGSQVTQLRDKSGNNNHSNPSGQKPLITTNGLTGKQCINMDPSDSGITLTTPQVNSTFTFFLVYKLPVTPGNVLVGGGSGNNNFISPSGSIIGIGGAGTQSYQFDDAMTEMVVFAIRQNSGVAQYWEFNGRQRLRTTGSVPSNPFYLYAIGAMNGGSWCGGTFGGFAYYNSFLSDTDMKKVVKNLVQTHNINPTPYYKIIGFGDSHTVGVGADAGNGWLYQLGASLGKKVVVEGISGSLFQDITGTDVNSGYNRYKRNLIEYPANDRLYIMYGFNDIPNGSTSLGTYTTELTTMVTDLLAAGYPASRIYIGTIPRYYGNANSVAVQDYGNAIRTICTTYGLHCAEVYNALVSDGRGDALYYADNLHFNNDGHTVIANAFLAS